MNDLLKKILYFKKEGSLLIILLYCILSFYLCYLFWYVVERLQLINHLNITLLNIIHGTNPTIETIQKICGGFDISLGTFFNTDYFYEIYDDE